MACINRFSATIRSIFGRIRSHLSQRYNTDSLRLTPSRLQIVSVRKKTSTKCACLISSSNNAPSSLSNKLTNSLHNPSVRDLCIKLSEINRDSIETVFFFLGRDSDKTTGAKDNCCADSMVKKSRNSRGNNSSASSASHSCGKTIPIKNRLKNHLIMSIIVLFPRLSAKWTKTESNC